MSEFLEKMGFKKKTHVGISVSANNFIELVCVDPVTKSVIKYASGNIKYNNAIREIMDYDEFAEVIEGLFADAGLVPQECSVTLNLPNVHFGMSVMESAAEENFLIDNLQSEIEDLYIFKRNEPIISYSTLNSANNRTDKNIIYSAIQTKVIVKLVEIFDRLEVELVRVDNAYSSLLKAIGFCDSLNKFVQKEEKSTILLVTPNSCCSFYMNGNIIVDYSEEPLAIKSFSTEEVYSTISKIAAGAIQKNNPASLLIISETEEIDSKILAQNLSFAGEIECLNKSLNASDKFIEVSGAGEDIDANMISYMTIEAVGAAVATYEEYPIDINFLPSERIAKNIISVGGYEVDLIRFAVFVILLAVIAGAVVAFIINAYFSTQIGALSKDNEKVNSSIEVFKKKIDTNQADKEESLFPVLTGIVERNKSVIEIYNGLSSKIPDSIYIQKFVANPQGGIGISGESHNSDTIGTFLNGLKEIKPDLQTTRMQSNQLEQSPVSKIPDGYTFQITTPTIPVSFEDEQVMFNNGMGMPGGQAENNDFYNNNSMPGGRDGLTPPPSPVI